MNCGHVYQYLCDHLDEETDSARCRRIKAHLESCPDCRSYLDSLKKTVLLFRALPEPRVPQQAHRKLLKTLTALKESPKRKKRAIRAG